MDSVVNKDTSGVAGKDETAYLAWLQQRAMLSHYDALVQRFSGQARQWTNGFGDPAPEAVLKTTSVWLATYPDAMMGKPGASVLESLGDSRLMDTLSEIGIRAIHTGPVKRAGAISGRSYSPSIDGHFDRIGNEVDPAYGTASEYRAAVCKGNQAGITLIGDIVPGHTGKGADFRLAERGVAPYPGLYSMIEIDEAHWDLLPDIAPGDDSANLSVAAAERLRTAGYSPLGVFDIEVFNRAGIKETSWSATDIVTGADGVSRRWVYLHIFKQGQPSLNWSDPSFAAHRLITADILGSLHDLGANGVRLDATMFLGIEPRGKGQANWLGGHPLSRQVTDQLGTLIRKFGGFSFQELNTDMQRLGRALEYGPDLSYDFVTRPALFHALVSEQASVLRLTLREMLRNGLSVTRLVHGLQNHDEIMLESMHFAVNADTTFELDGMPRSGASVFETIHKTVLDRTTGEVAPYNRAFAMSPGLCSTVAGLIAPTLGVRDLATLNPQQIDEIRARHLLAVAFSALQGGVVALSGWDLVGALPVAPEALGALVDDGDWRWINRGAYDLMDQSGAATTSPLGLPRARALYGSLPQQLDDPMSFVSQVKGLLSVRERYQLALSEIVEVPDTGSKSVLAFRLALPDGTQGLTLANFSGASVQVSIALEDEDCSSELAWSSSSSDRASTDQSTGPAFSTTLAPYEAQFHHLS